MKMYILQVCLSDRDAEKPLKKVSRGWIFLSLSNTREITDKTYYQSTYFEHYLSAVDNLPTNTLKKMRSRAYK